MERQTNSNENLTSRVTVAEIRQNENDPHSPVTRIEVKIDGTEKAATPITSLVELAQDFYLSNLDTCQTRVLLDSYLGNSQTEAKWRGNPSAQLRNKLEHIHPFHLIRAISGNNKVISINFVGKGDWDRSGVDTDFENNILCQFVGDTLFLNSNFPKNGGLTVLIKNGSDTGERHGLASEKHIIKNMVNLFNAAHTRTLAQIRNQTQNFAQQLTSHLRTCPNNNSTIQLFEPNPDPNRPNMKGTVTELGQRVERLLDDNFKSFAKKFDAQQIMVLFDDAYASLYNFSQNDKSEFVARFVETLTQHLPTFLNLPFDLKSNNYNFDFENTHEQISDNQMAPLHYFQCILYSFILRRLSRPLSERQQIMRNIFNLISAFEKPIDNFESNISPIAYISNSLSNGTVNQTDIDAVNSMLEILYPAISHTEHVTQFNIAKLDPNRNLNEGFLLPNHNVFVIPEQALSQLYNFSLENLTSEKIPLLDSNELNDSRFANSLAQHDFIKYLTKSQIHKVSSHNIIEIFVPHLNYEQIPFLDSQSFRSTTIDLLVQYNLIPYLTDEQISNCQRCDAIEAFITHFNSEKLPLLNARYFAASTINLLAQRNLISQLSENQVSNLYDSNAINAVITFLDSARFKLLNAKRFGDSTINRLAQLGLIHQLTENQISNCSAINALLPHLESRKIPLLNVRYFAKSTIDLLVERDLIHHFLTPKNVPLFRAWCFDRSLFDLLDQHNLIKYITDFQIYNFDYEQINAFIPYVGVIDPDDERNSDLAAKQFSLFDARRFDNSMFSYLEEWDLLQYITAEQINICVGEGRTGILSYIGHIKPEQVALIDTSYNTTVVTRSLIEHNLDQYLTGKQISHIRNTNTINILIPRLTPEKIPSLCSQKFNVETINLLVQHDFIRLLTDEQISGIEWYTNTINALIPHLNPEKVPFLYARSFDVETIKLLVQHSFIQYLTDKQISDIWHTDAINTIIPYLHCEKILFLKAYYFTADTINLLVERNLTQYLTNEQISNLRNTNAINTLIPYLNHEQISLLTAGSFYGDVYFNAETINLLVQRNLTQYLTNEQISELRRCDVINILIPHLNSQNVPFLPAGSFEISTIDLLAQHNFIQYITGEQISRIRTTSKINALIPHLNHEQIPFLKVKVQDVFRGNILLFNEETINLLDQYNLLQYLTEEQISNCQYRDRINALMPPSNPVQIEDLQTPNQNPVQTEERMEEPLQPDNSLPHIPTSDPHLTGNRTKYNATKIVCIALTVLGFLTTALGIASQFLTLGIPNPVSIALMATGIACITARLGYKSYKNKQDNDTGLINNNFEPDMVPENEEHFLTQGRMQDAQVTTQNQFGNQPQLANETENII